MSGTDELQGIHEKTRQAYNLAAQKYHDLFHNEMNEKEYDRRLLDLFASGFAADSLVLDAGCGPSAHIGRYVADKGIPVVGVDISDDCIELARRVNPGLRFERGDIARLEFPDETFDGVIAYYSIIHTPKRHLGRVFGEFRRVLKPGGSLLVAVKAGSGDGYLSELLGIETVIYFSLFSVAEISGFFDQAGFALEFLEKRNPYDFEISNERIFAIGRRTGKMHERNNGKIL